MSNEQSKTISWLSWLTDRDELDLKNNQNTVANTLVSQYDYSVNSISQRTQVSTSGAAFSAAASVDWSYDALGQVVRTGHNTNAASDFAYAYDLMGNRKKSSRNTLNLITASGANLAVCRSGAAATDPAGGNGLNQYGRLELYGTAAVNNTYDLDGNQLSGRFFTTAMTPGVRTWDGENQLLSVKPVGSTAVQYTYDACHRRVAKRGVGGIASNTEYTLYDGWHPIAEYLHNSGSGSSFILQTSYTWGPDLTFVTCGIVNLALIWFIILSNSIIYQNGNSQSAHEPDKTTNFSIRKFALKRSSI